MSTSHLTETQLQGLADGTLRGPEGLAAREHCDSCSQCGGELQIWSGLSHRLSAMQDPLPPLDFTASVLARVEAREAHLQSRRHTLYAAVPAVAMALVAIVGFGLSTHLDRLLDGLTVLRTVFGVLSPVFAATRIPLGIGAFFFLAVVLTVLSRTLRPAYARAAES
jgi:anti-sigma factor RsiW